MRCTSPRTVGYQTDGKTLSWSPKNRSKEFAEFQLPCGKCLECRLEYARQWAIRCVHEAQMHEENCFITLTYSDEHLPSEKLQYRDFQLFMKRLRRAFPNQQIGCFVTGEYGERTKRPHWHAILFGWRPSDSAYKYTADCGDDVFTSKTLDQTWSHGNAEFGSVTFHSAGYCARYAAKKLVHGDDGDHDFQPISKKSSKHAIGKKWLEKYWRDVFNYGEIIGPDGQKLGAIPRYYEKWLKQHQPEEWTRYVTQTKQQKIDRATEKVDAEIRIQREILRHRSTKAVDRGRISANPKTRNQVRKEIKEQTIQKRLMSFLKL